jgi:two-component system, OmpR family, alkaline phosphatase synthesis response regulator PhoP
MTTAPKILLVDDDSDIVELLEYNLVKEGYDVIGITNPIHVFDAANTFLPDILVIDIVMPGLNGFDLCRLIRQTEVGKSLPIFFITSGEERLFEKAFESGGDDFIQKFSGLRTLINRINLVAKRKLIIRKRLDKIAIGHWLLNRKDKSAYHYSSLVSLSEIEFDLFYFLAQNAQRSIAIKSLTSVINGYEFFQRKISIAQHLRALAKKIGEELIVFTNEHRVKLNLSTQISPSSAKL